MRKSHQFYQRLYLFNCFPYRGFSELESCYFKEVFSPINFKSTLDKFIKNCIPVVAFNIERFIFSQWQNIMGILRNAFKILPLPLHNVANPKHCLTQASSLFLKIIKRGKGREKQNCPNSSLSHNFCHWLSEKSAKFVVRYFRVGHFESNWKHAFTNYVTFI